jgi:hypothetical protein
MQAGYNAQCAHQLQHSCIIADTPEATGCFIPNDCCETQNTTVNYEYRLVHK